VNDRDIDYTFSKLQKLIPGITKNVQRMCLDTLTYKEFVQRRTVQRTGILNFPGMQTEVTVYRITREGIDQVQGWDDGYYEKLSNALDGAIISESEEKENSLAIAEDQEEPIGEIKPEKATQNDWDKADWAGDLAGGPIATELTGSEEFTRVAPASNRIVPLNHNSDAYKEAISRLEEVSREIQKDHPIDNELGQEKQALIGALEAGRRLMEDTEIKLDIAIALLIEPLKIVAKRYEKEMVGAMAGGAVTLLLSLFGLLQLHAPAGKIQGGRLAGLDFGDGFVGPAIELVLGGGEGFIPARLVFEGFELLKKTLAEGILGFRRQHRRPLEGFFQEFCHGPQDRSCADKMVVG
jgi:hypothetical protein